MRAWIIKVNTVFTCKDTTRRMYSITTIHTQGNNKLKRKHSNIYLYIHTSIHTGEQINFKTMAHFNNVRIEVKKKQQPNNETKMCCINRRVSIKFLWKLVVNRFHQFAGFVIQFIPYILQHNKNIEHIILMDLISFETNWLVRIEKPVSIKHHTSY